MSTLSAPGIVYRRLISRRIESDVIACGDRRPASAPTFRAFAYKQRLGHHLLRTGSHARIRGNSAFFPSLRNVNIHQTFNHWTCGGWGPLIVHAEIAWDGSPSQAESRSRNKVTKARPIGRIKSPRGDPGATQHASVHQIHHRARLMLTPPSLQTRLLAKTSADSLDESW